jgi:hypothetical protein
MASRGHVIVVLWFVSPRFASRETSKAFPVVRFDSESHTRISLTAAMSVRKRVRKRGRNRKGKYRHSAIEKLRLHFANRLKLFANQERCVPFSWYMGT